MDPNAPPFFPYSGTQEERGEIHEVVRGRVYQTNWKGADNLEKVKALGITHIVAAGEEFLVERQEDFPLNKLGLNIRYHALSVNDDEEEEGTMRGILADAVAFIDGALATSSKSKVLVHCAAGISRSSTVTLAYLMHGRQQSLRQAFETLYSARRVCWPNSGFMRLLISVEKAQAQSRGKTAANGRFIPTIDLAEYEQWSEYDPEAYAAAKTVDRSSKAPLCE